MDYREIARQIAIEEGVDPDLFARLVQHERRIVELDINPLLVTPDSVLALDARIVVRA